VVLVYIYTPNPLPNSITFSIQRQGRDERRKNFRLTNAENFTPPLTPHKKYDMCWLQDLSRNLPAKYHNLKCRQILRQRVLASIAKCQLFRLARVLASIVKSQHIFTLAVLASTAKRWHFTLVRGRFPLRPLAYYAKF